MHATLLLLPHPPLVSQVPRGRAEPRVGVGEEDGGQEGAVRPHAQPGKQDGRQRQEGAVALAAAEPEVLRAQLLKIIRINVTWRKF